MNYKSILTLLATTVISCSSGSCYNKEIKTEKIPAGAEKVLSPLEHAAAEIGKEGVKFAKDVELIGECKEVNKVKECKIEGIRIGDTAVFDKIRYGSPLEIHSIYNKNDKIEQVQDPDTGEIFYRRSNIRAIDYINIDPPQHFYRRWEIKTEIGTIDSQGELQVESVRRNVLCNNSIGEKIKVENGECIP